MNERPTSEQVAADFLRRGVGDENTKGVEPSPDEIAKRAKLVTLRRGKLDRQDARDRRRLDAAHLKRVLELPLNGEELRGTVGRMVREYSKDQPDEVRSALQNQIRQIEVKRGQAERILADAELKDAVVDTANALRERHAAGGMSGLGKGKKISLEAFATKHFESFGSLVAPELPANVIKLLSGGDSDKRAFERRPGKTHAQSAKDALRTLDERHAILKELEDNLDKKAA